MNIQSGSNLAQTKKSLLTATTQLLELLQVKVSSRTVKNTLASHPDYPSLLSMVDSLNEWHLETIVLKVETDKLGELPIPFIMSLKNGYFLIVKKVTAETIVCLVHKNEEQIVAKKDIQQQWDGVVLFAETGKESGEVNRNKTRQKERLKAKRHKKIVRQTKSLLTRVDDRIIPENTDEVRLFAIARNESLRLPYFLDYYLKNLNVDRIFLIDNNSTDDTIDIALSRDKVHVFKIEQNYNKHWNWMEYFLERYGKKKWCIVVDIDELLAFPFYENLSLQELIKYLDDNHFTAFSSLLLDIYSNKPIKDTYYKPNEDPLKICRFFDRTYEKNKMLFFDKKKWTAFESFTYKGGIRQRVFGKARDRQQWVFSLSKVPLFKYSEKIYLAQGMHAINGASMADITGVVFHTKFLFDFVKSAREESLREQHFFNGAEYKIYHNRLSNNPELTLKNDQSIEFKNSEQLIDLGLIEVSKNFMTHLKSGKLLD